MKGINRRKAWTNCLHPPGGSNGDGTKKSPDETEFPLFIRTLQPEFYLNLYSLVDSFTCSLVSLSTYLFLVG